MNPGAPWHHTSPLDPELTELTLEPRHRKEGEFAGWVFLLPGTTTRKTTRKTTSHNESSKLWSSKASALMGRLCGITLYN